MSSKSKDKAAATRNDLGGGDGGGGDVGASVQPCPLKNHWIRIIVKDSDNKPVTDVKPTVEVDGSTNSVTLDKTGKYDTKKVLQSTTPAKITFPTLFNCDWWPDGSTAPTPVGEKDLTAVAAGDCAVRMAATEGYRSYHDIWDAPENAGLKPTRPNPNSLLVADALKGPDKKDKSETKAVDQEWTFIVRAVKKPSLRFVIVDRELKPWKDVKCALSGAASKSATTGADGLFEIKDVDPKATAGTLKLTLPPPPKKPKTPAAVAGPLSDPPPYPLPLKTTEFEDKPVTNKLATKMEFELKIGSLPAHKDKSGTLARMQNMAFLSDVTAADEIVTRCVKAYQKDILDEDAPSGAFADIQEEIETRHTKA